MRLSQDSGGGLLLLGSQVKAGAGHGGHFQIAVTDHGLKQIILPGGGLNVDITCHIVRIIGVGGGVASVLSNRKIHVFVGPVAFAAFLRQSACVHSAEQDLGHSGIHEGEQGGRDAHVSGGDGGVLRDHPGGAVIIHHNVPVDAVVSHEVLGIRGGNALPLCLQKCFASHISKSPDQPKLAMMMMSPEVVAAVCTVHPVSISPALALEPKEIAPVATVTSTFCPTVADPVAAM